MLIAHQVNKPLVGRNPDRHRAGTAHRCRPFIGLNGSSLRRQGLWHPSSDYALFLFFLPFWRMADDRDELFNSTRGRRRRRPRPRHGDNLRPN